MKTMTELGFAKINLHLDITGRRADAYHDVATVMQSISLCDRVTVALRDGGAMTLACDREGIPTDESNLAVRAARMYLNEIDKKQGLHIEIEKKIPMAAGLAGGSADAAATLRALNRLLDEPLSIDALCAIGARLGADVPFCIVGGTVYADGRGDRLSAFAPMPDCHIVVACGTEGISTPWAYRLLDDTYSNFDGTCYTPHTVEKLETAMRAGEIRAIAEATYNVFEDPVLSARPVAAEIRRMMLDGGALGAMMSGSGPSIFGIFDDADHAGNVTKCLLARGYFAVCCRPVAHL